MRPQFDQDLADRGGRDLGRLGATSQDRPQFPNADPNHDRSDHPRGGNLDPDLSLEVMRIFRRFNEVGVTLLIASHDIALIDRLGCRRIELEDGRLAPPVFEADDEEEDGWQ